MNLTTLLKNTKRLRGKLTKATNGKFFKKKYNRRTKELMITAQFRGESEPGTHEPRIVFQNISYSDSKSNRFPIPFKSKNGYIYLSRPKKASEVKVSCRCSDYRFTWYWYNKKEKIHWGQPFPKYERKTDDWPERNPLHVSGVCKHIISLMAMAQDKGVM